MCGDNGEDKGDVDYDCKYGSKFEFDASFEGPKKRRSCTDVLCFALFVVFLIAWAIVSVFAYRFGSPERLLYPTDSLGQRCGVDEGVKDKPFLFFFDLSRCAKPTVIVTGCPTPQICVKECPTQDFSSFLYTDTFETQGRKLLTWNQEIPKKMICKYDFPTASITNAELLKKAVANNDCSPWYLSSKSSAKFRINEHHPEIRNPFLGRCLPIPLPRERKEGDKPVKLLGGEGKLKCNAKATSDPYYIDLLMMCLRHNFLSYTEAFEVGEMVLQDLVRVWPYVLLGLVIAMVVCLVFILIMRWLAGLMVWLSIVGVLALLSFGVYLCYTRYASLPVTNGKGTPMPSTDVDEFVLERSSTFDLELTDIFRVNFKSYLAKRETWMVFLIITASVLAIILLILIFLRNRIRIAIELIREASRAVGSVTSSLFFPIVPWLIQLLALAWGLSVALYLASSGRAEHRVTSSKNECNCATGAKPGDICDPKEFHLDCITGDCSCQFFADRTDGYIPWLQAFNLFGTLWLLFFISALGEMVLAGVFGAWYWTWNKAKGLPFFALTESIWRAFRYHIGTLAFGSLLIAICRFIRIMLEYIHHKLKKRDNKLVQCLLCCLRCCFWCLEKFLRFLSRNAYVMCAIHGTNFCRSAKDAFNLLMRNVVRVVVLDKVTDFLLFLGKILIVAGMSVSAYYVFGHQSTYLDKHVPELNYYFLPIIVIAVGTYFIATIFFGVYAMAVDTLFLCFLEDSERNDGSTEKPYFMSKNLMKILGKKNQFRDAD